MGGGGGGGRNKGKSGYRYVGKVRKGKGGNG